MVPEGTSPFLGCIPLDIPIPWGSPWVPGELHPPDLPIPRGPHAPDELLEERSGLGWLVQGHDALVAQEALEDLALEAQQQLVRVEHLGLVGGGRADPQHRVAAVAVLQQLLQPLQQRQRVVDGGRRGVPAKVGFLGCREMGPSQSCTSVPGTEVGWGYWGAVHLLPPLPQCQRAAGAKGVRGDKGHGDICVPGSQKTAFLQQKG